MAQYTTTEVDESRYNYWSTAPNGSARHHDHWTVVTFRQDWADVPENGIYAGRSYRITERYLSSSPDRRGQFIDSSSSPWIDDATQRGGIYTGTEDDE